MKKKDYLILAALACLPILLVFILVPNDSLFANNVDWLSQHSVIPAYFRELFYNNHNLFPDYAAHLGGGANIYAFSYYGLFRPDILISYLLPNVDMALIIIVYMIFLMSLGSCLCYIWLRKKGYARSICIFASFLLICSSFFYQAHKQIMFVNYLPFLFLAFIATDSYFKKQKTIGITISVVLIIVHSYFFSVAAIIICICYFLYELLQRDKQIRKQLCTPFVLHYMAAVMIAIMIAGILLLPTAAVLLEQTKDVAQTTFHQILSISPDLKGLLYSAYGCGLSMLAWISLLLGTNYQKSRKLSFALMIAFLFPFIAYLLNGTLYARTKILIVFLPLVLWIIAEVLTQAKKQQLIIKPYQLPLMVLPVLFYQGKSIWILLDVIFSLFLLILYSKKTKSQILFILALLPLYFLTQTNNANTFLKKEVYAKANNSHKQALIHTYQSTLEGRSDDLTSPLANANRLNSLAEYKTSSYTSTNNTLYNIYCYDIMKNPISIVNRVANLTNSNIFFQGMMGVTTIYTKQLMPIGYQAVKQNQDIIIAENQNVLPIAYATNQVMNEADFDKLSYPFTLDTIYNNAIVKNGNGSYESKMQKTLLDTHIRSRSKHLTLEKKADDIAVKANKNAKLSLAIHNDLTNKILLISFSVTDVKNADTQDIAININGINNKLARNNAPYPNNNHHFTYILSGNEKLDKLDISFTKGEYKLKNIEIYTLDYDVIKNRKQEVDALTLEKTKNNEVIKGNINVQKDGYLITSLPYQKGYTIYLDHKKIEGEIVNKAFLGFMIPSGNHSIKIEFHAPMKTAGMYMSILGCVLLIIHLVYERSKP